MSEPVETRPEARPVAPRPPSLAEHVRLVVRDDIVTGRLQPGERLTETDLIGRTGVSRTPIREALRLLEAEGLVVYRRSRGSYVSYQLSGEEASVVYDCRLELEPFLTATAARKITPERLDRIRSAAARFAEAVASGAIGAELGKLDGEFHSEIYAASESQLKDIVRSYWSKLQLQLSTRVYGAENPMHFVREHGEIVDALDRGDVRAARRAMSRHLQHGKDILERSYSRTGTGRDGAEQ